MLQTPREFFSISKQCEACLYFIENHYVPLCHLHTIHPWILGPEQLKFWQRTVHIHPDMLRISCMSNLYFTRVGVWRGKIQIMEKWYVRLRRQWRHNSCDVSLCVVTPRDSDGVAGGVELEMVATSLSRPCAWRSNNSWYTHTDSLSCNMLVFLCSKLLSFLWVLFFCKENLGARLAQIVKLF